MRIGNTGYILTQTGDTMHLSVAGLNISFTSWRDLSQEGIPFLILFCDGTPVADIQGKTAPIIIDALDNYGMR